MEFSSINGSTSKRFFQFYRQNGEELNQLHYFHFSVSFLVLPRSYFRVPLSCLVLQPIPLSMFLHFTHLQRNEVKREGKAASTLSENTKSWALFALRGPFIHGQARISLGRGRARTDRG